MNERMKVEKETLTSFGEDTFTYQTVMCRTEKVSLPYVFANRYGDHSIVHVLAWDFNRNDLGWESSERIEDGDAGVCKMYDDMLKIKDYLLNYHEAEDGTLISGLEDAFDNTLAYMKSIKHGSGADKAFEGVLNAYAELKKQAALAGVDVAEEERTGAEAYLRIVAEAIGHAAYHTYRYRKGGKKA